MEKKEYWYIYKTTNLVNGKIYVGMHKVRQQRLDERYYGSGKYLNNAIKKYGIENFICEIIEFNDSDAENREREKYWIKELNTIIPNGYNMSPGGEGGACFDKESNKYISINSWKNLTLEEHKARVAKMQEGLHRPEALKKISEASKRWHQSMTEKERKEYGKNCSETWTDGRRNKMSKLLSERNKLLKGKSILDTFIERYGEIDGKKHYDDYIAKQKATALKNKEKNSAKIKATFEKRKLYPKYKEYNLQKALIQNMRTLLKRGKISKEEFDLNYNRELLKFEDLKKDLRRFLNDFDNGETI